MRRCPLLDTKEMRPMNMRRASLLMVALFTVTGLMAACGSSSLRVGWRAFDGPRRKRANYATFTGVERATFRVEAGADVELDYEIEVGEGGLCLEFQDPDGETLWEDTFREGADDVVRVTAPQDGRYRLHIEGRSAAGGYDVTWSVGDG
jgi:hypothetical protein